MNKTLNKIISYYLNSHDFNGMPVYKLLNDEKEKIYKLIDEGLIEVLSSEEVVNPHIRTAKLNIDKKVQKSHINDSSTSVVLYPSQLALKNIQTNTEQPYTSLLQKGENQLKIKYFDIQILEIYNNNPKYLILDLGYRGNISVHEEYEDENEKEYVRDYGIAYFKNNKHKKAVGAFVGDLSRLNPKRQQLWYSFECSNQQDYIINYDFYKNTIEGSWVNNTWAFNALLMEMEKINELCSAIGLPKFFRKTFHYEGFSYPDGYRSLLLPTEKNYYDFILVLEKLVVSNINLKVFTEQVDMIKNIERFDDEQKEKPSLQLFEEWLLKNIKTTDEEKLKEVIIKPLRDIRKIRQKPAHEFNSNKYNEEFYKKQEDIMDRLILALGNLMYLLGTHPCAESVKTLDLDEMNIVFY